MLRLSATTAGRKSSAHNRTQIADICALGGPPRVLDYANAAFTL